MALGYQTPAAPNPTQYTGDNPVLQGISDAASLASTGYGIYQGVNLTRDANTVLSQSNPFGQYRGIYGQDLLQLIQDPSSLTKQPGYQFLMDQGTAAIDRSAAAPGGVGFGSGAEALQLEQFGQGLASSFYNQQTGLLAQLAGANINPANPAQALQGVAGAGNILGQASGMINPTLNLLSKLFPGTSISSAPGQDNPFATVNPATGVPTMLDPSTATSPDFSQTPQWVPPPTDPSGGITYDSPFSFSAAGGEAAGQPQLVDPGMSDINAAAGSGQYNIAMPRSPIAQGVGYAQDVLGLVGGLQRGGTMGYAGAGLSAADLASKAGLIGGAGGFIPVVGSALAAYSTIKGWQPGASGRNALTGAETGAEIGAFAGPIGMGIGAIIGGAAGAISGLMGNPGKAEMAPWQSFASQFNKLTPAQQTQVIASMPAGAAFQNLGSIMSAETNKPGHSEPIEQVFGRMGEDNLMRQMATYINQQYKAGKITAGESVQDQWTKVVYPWLVSKGATIDPNQRTARGTPEGSALIADLQSLIGSYESGQHVISGLPNFGS